MSSTPSSSVGSTNSGLAGSDSAAVTDCVVVIPTRDRAPRIVTCLQSLVRQTVTGFAVVVVNDGATDETAARLDAFAEQLLPFRFHVLTHEEPRGANPSRNEAIASSVESIVAFLDDDCIADPDWLEHLLAPFADAKVAAVTGLVTNVKQRTMSSRFFIGAHRVVPRMIEGVPHATRLVAGNMAVRRPFLAHGLSTQRSRTDWRRFSLGSVG